MTESDCSSARKKGDLSVPPPPSFLGFRSEFGRKKGKGELTGLGLHRGFFGPGEMQKEFEEVAFALKPGEVSHIVDTPSGVHLIQR